MACLLKPVANFADLESVRLILFPDERKPRQHGDDVWVRPTEDRREPFLPEASSPASIKDSSWLQKCEISLSSTSELLVICRNNIMVILTTKWNSQEESEVKSKFHVTWHGNPCRVGEQITSVLCLPLISQGKSSHCGPDWTCIVAGFTSGYVRFYTENCDELVSEILHNEPVKYLKCQTFQTPQYTTSREPTEEVYAVYPSLVCIIPGFGLFQTLRACRNQLARVQANCVEAINAPPLTLKKLGFTEQEVITDCEVVGKATENTFDHLMTASVCGGFDSWYRSSAPQTSLMIASGKKPFVGFHYSLEGGTTPVLADVAKVMANKLKSAIGNAVPSWLTGGRKSSYIEKPKEAPLEPVETMECRFGLCDNWRHGDCMVISPNRRLSVVCDSLGRIILIDNLKGIAVRMWKGYREAQCGWLEAKEEQKQGHHSSRNLKTALFLVIYSPKKGIIEIWSMQEGPKVASFSVTKTGRLLYIDYGLMGLNNIQLKGGNNCQTPCLFFDQSGILREISVPFHFALCAKNSKRARDIHILKKLKVFLKAEECDESALQEEVVKTLGELTTSEIQLQALQFLSSNHAISPDALWAACNVALDKWHVANETELQQVDPGMKRLSEFTQKLQRVVELYRYLHQLNQRPPDYSTVVDSNLNASVLSEKLLTPQREINILLNLITTIQALNVKSKVRFEGRVTFGGGTQSHFIEFISCFETCNSNQDGFTIGLKESFLDEELKRTSQLLYQGTLYSDCSIGEWKDAVMKSAIRPAHLMKLALVFWLSRRQGAALEVEMLRFAEILTAICTLADAAVVCGGSNEPSPWWRDVRAILSDATDAFMGLTAAIVCRAVALHIEHAKDRPVPKEREASGLDAHGPSEAGEDEAGKSAGALEALASAPRNSNSEWENVSIDTCQWSMLIGQLEDVALLATVLRQKPPTEKTCPRYCIPFVNLDVSLSDILSKGKGSVSELTARWISFSTIDPKHLIDVTDAELGGTDNPSHSGSPSKVKNVGVKEGRPMSVEMGADATKADHVNSGMLESVAILRRHFPYSLSSSVLLTNVCWEYMRAWHHSFDALEPALAFLQAIPSAVVKQGLCNLVWTKHLKQRFETAVLLIQKVGKAPKERLIRQEVSISEEELQKFFDICQRFFDVFMEVLYSSDVMAVGTIPNRSEELWPDDVGGPPSLVDLVLGQHTAEYEVVHLHHQLALAMHMLLALNVKCTRPLSTLFDNSGQAVFFSDLSGHPSLPSHNPDRKLLDSRCQFLFRAISAGMQTIRLPDYKSETDETPPDPSTAIFWMSKCHALGADWGVSSDKLRRHQVCELYSSGFDQLAEEIIPAVVDLSLLASQLMLIVGQRIKYIVSTSRDLGGKMSKLSPNLSSWLDSLVNNLKNCTCPLADTAQLLVHVMQYLPESHTDYNLALQMVEAVHSFRDSDAS